MSTDTANTGTGTETVGQDTAKSNTEAKPAGNGDWAAGLSESGQAAETQGQPAPEESQDDDSSEGLLPDKKAEQTPDTKKDGDTAEKDGGDKPLDIVIPEGFQRDEAKMKWLNDFAREAKLSKESAQKAMDFYCQAVDEQHKGLQAFIHDQRMKIDQEGNAAIHADPEIGGENFDASATYAEKAIRHFMNKKGEYGAIKQLYHDANIRNNPLMFKMLARIGKYISEAEPLAGDARSKERQSTADMFFPDLKGK